MPTATRHPFRHPPMLQILLSAWRHRPTHIAVWALAVPMVLSNLTVPLVTLVSSTVIGHLPHAYQLGAVAVGAGFYTLLAALAGTLRMGTTGFAAQAAGQNDDAALRRILVQSLALGLAFSVLLGTVALPLANVALGFMTTSPELATLARDFFRIRLLGLPAMLMQYAMVGWLLGRQNARAPLAIMVVTNVCNILLVVALVQGLGWGVAGAAVASVGAEWLGLAFGALVVRRHVVQLSGMVHWPLLRRVSSWAPLLQTNRDIFIRTLALQAVFLSVTLRGARLGDATVAANALLLNGLMVCSYALDGLAHAVEALCGHAIGARRRLALRRALVVASGWSALISLVFAAGFLMFGDRFIAMQTSMAEVRATARHYVVYLAALPLVAVWSYVLDGLYIGATKAREMRNLMLVSVLLTLPVAMLLLRWQNHGLWLALLAFMAIRAAAMTSNAISLQRRGAWIAAPSGHGQGQKAGPKPADL